MNGTDQRKIETYRELQRETAAILVELWISNLANVSALLYHGLSDINWVGFYLAKERELFLGPFQGKPACLYIPFDKGVCGAAAKSGESVIVKDVHEFPGHIACDAASRSEIVVPILLDGKVLAVLDVDSPSVGRFDQADQEGLEEIVRTVVSKTRWPKSLID
jgi:L-methionine (R)-S-oxide reductase